MQSAFSTNDAMTVLPEIVLAGGAMALLMLGVFRKGDSTALITWLCVGLLVAAGILILLAGGGRVTAFGTVS